MAEVKSKGMGNLNHTTFKKELVGDTAILKGEAKAGGNLYLTEAEEAGISKATIKKIADFNAEYSRKAVDRMIKTAEEELVAHKATKQVKLELPFGINKNEKIEVLVERERERRNIQTGEKYMTPSIKVKVAKKDTMVSKTHIRELKNNLAKTLGM